MGVREERLAAIEARLDQVWAARSDPDNPVEGKLDQVWAPVLDPDAMVEARQLAAAVEDDDLQARTLLGWFHWYRCLALPLGQDRQNCLNIAINMFIPCFLAGTGDVPGALMLTLANQADPIATALFEQIGNSTDQDLISAVVNLWQNIVDATPTSHPDRGMRLSNLGLALQIRFLRTGAQADLESAIKVGRTAVQATPDDYPQQAVCLMNLGVALHHRFIRDGVHADLESAIHNYQQAVQATPDDHPDRAGILSNLGSAQAYFEITGAQAHLESAIHNLQQAVHATPYDHPDRAAILSNLAIAQLDQCEKTRAPADFHATFQVLHEAVDADSSAPSVRIRAARLAAALVSGVDPGKAASLAEAAVRLLPEVAPRQLERGDQQDALVGFTGVAGDAAALVLADPNASSDHRAAKALRLLEEGRAVLLSQMLDTRSDLSDLREHHPPLAAQFTELRDRLDEPSATIVPVPSLPNGIVATTWPSQAVEIRRQLAGKFADVLAQIRSQYGFASFALPPTIEELLIHAAYGSVVVFNVSSYRSDALLLATDGVTALELPDLTYEVVREQISAFQRALHRANDIHASPGERKSAQAQLRQILEWLWDAGAEPVLDALGHHNEPLPGSAWPRVWWAPGGLLGQLPLHAAGHHTDPADQPGRRSVLDRVVSSYTPTIRALHYARQQAQTTVAALQALIVAMPLTPGLPDQGRLHHVPAEVATLCARLPGSLVLAEPAYPEHKFSRLQRAATKANVLSHLPDCTIAHFACHGTSDPTDPSSSQLLLHDHDTDPLTIASLAAVRLDQAQLAYLSACRTAFTGASELIDEAIHLTSAFQLAGFPHVVGTLWEIDDAIAVEVAETFYTALDSGDGTLDISQAAYALHHAVRAARDKLPRIPSLWAAYLHAGA